MTELAAVMRIMAASAHERRNDMQLHVSLLDLEQAFLIVSRPNDFMLHWWTVQYIQHW